MDTPPTAAMTQRAPAQPKSILQRIFNLHTQPIWKPSLSLITALPETSASRLAESRPTQCPEQTILSRSPAAQALTPHPDAAKTVLYLAYGSNLSAETFLNGRGIRPLSAVNVSAPSLRLTFDLAGVPYSEPCFANTAPRKIPGVPDKPPKLPDPPEIPSPPNTTQDLERGSHGDPSWDKGLIGVVYEVTPEDYAHIVATEGGGASYADILVPCIALPKPRIGVPERPPVPPEVPRPFLAHTLCAPRVPDLPDGDEGDQDAPKVPRWALRYLRRVQRPDPDYAQPSLRYLKLIRDGAAEHQLPGEYQAWLAQLAPYTMTSSRQRVGQIVMGLFWLPVFAVLFPLSKLLVDGKGKLPLWYAVVMGAMFSLLWKSYDVFLKPVFGDGERTEETEEERTANGEKKPLLG